MLKKKKLWFDFGLYLAHAKIKDRKRKKRKKNYHSRHAKKLQILEVERLYRQMQ